MTKKEFEELSIRGGGEISDLLYDQIERYYMSTNRYHEAHGGVDESKQAFVKRVFGGKVNSATTVALKIIAESCRENRWALRGNDAATKDRLDEMDNLIAEHTSWEAVGGHNSIERYKLLKLWDKNENRLMSR